MRNATVLASWLILAGAAQAARAADVDLSGLDPRSTVTVTPAPGAVELGWAGPDGKRIALRVGTAVSVNFTATLQDTQGKPTHVFENATPNFTLRVGERDLKTNGWTIFFDKVDDRPFKTFPVTFSPDHAKVTSTAHRAVVTVGPVRAGEGKDLFEGDLQLTVYDGSPLVQIEPVLTTQSDARAITFTGGIDLPRDQITGAGYEDYLGRPHDVLATPPPATAPDGHPIDPASVRARLRTVLAKTTGGTVALFPPPHQFFYPTDFANNFGFNRLEVTGAAVHLGIAQPIHADGRFRPWVNAPPNTAQRLCLFLALNSDTTPDALLHALAQVAAYTRNDRVPEIPGHQAMVSHVHLEHTQEFLRQQRESTDTDSIPAALENPGWVQTFKARGIHIVHLAEFHLGDTPKRPAPQRLRELHTLHSEANRLSNPDFLVLPGEEPNVHLGGHWISLFPKPVYWTLNRAKDEPFEEQLPTGETMYRVGNSADVLHLMEKENGLMWTAHPRIKASQGFPDAYIPKDYFQSDHFLGGAWKAMPADFSLDRLGTRVLDLENDLANKGLHKNILGEIDLFGIEPNYELYGHLNVNYLELNQLPKFTEGWQPVLTALRQGRYFTTTGEVLITNVTAANHSPGSTLPRAEATHETPITATLQFTFPPAFAELITGDGEKTYRQRIDLTDLPAFSKKSLTVNADLRNMKWIRVEAWDIARNGAFTPALWIP